MIELHQSALKVGITGSMLKMRDYITRPHDRQTAAMRFGTLAHRAILEPDHSAIIWEGGRRSGKAWDEFEAAHGDDYMTPDEFEAVRAMADAMKANETAQKLLYGMTTEHDIHWDGGPQIGPCGGRVDAWQPGRIVDYKTTSSIDARWFGIQAGKMGYHLQLAWYRFGLAEIMKNEPRPPQSWDCYIIAQESAPPHEIAIYRVQPMHIYGAMQQAMMTARRYRDCEKAGVYPSRYSGVLDLEIPYLEIPDYMLTPEVPADSITAGEIE